MGKAKTTVVASVNPDVNVDFKVTKEDLVSITVAKHEQHLLSEKDRFAKEIKAANKNGKDLQTSLAEKVKQHVEGLAKKEIKALEKALSAFKSKGTVSHWIDKKEIVYTIHVIDEHKRVCLSREMRCKTPQAIVKIETKVEKNSELVVDLQEKSMTVRRDLSRLSTTERQARAAFAQSVLEQSEQGKAFLASMDKGVLKLPNFG